MIKATAAYTDTNSNLKCYPTIINKATIQNGVLSVIITNNSDNKVCIPKDITIETVESLTLVVLAYMRLH